MIEQMGIDYDFGYTQYNNVSKKWAAFNLNGGFEGRFDVEREARDFLENLERTNAPVTHQK